jgi:hypothetical protein
MAGKSRTRALVTALVTIPLLTIAMAPRAHTSAAMDICVERTGCPGGPDNCATISYPDGSALTCYKTVGGGGEGPGT